MSNYITIKLRRGTATQWATTNPVLAEGELGLETDTRKFKVGNNVTAWNSLQYWGGSGGGAADFTDLGDVPASYFGAAGQYVKVNGTADGLEFGTLTIAAGDLPSGIDAAKIANGSVSNTEFQYLNGLTSEIQTQLDSKVDENAAITPGTKTKITYDAKGLVTSGADAGIADITGLQTALDGKVDENAAITGATKTKITYDAKGLVTAGADATTADIADSNDKRYVTEAEKTKLSNLSGTNTGDQNLFSTIAVSGQSNVVADGTGDTLTLVAGSHITITTDATTDTITISGTGGGGGGTDWGDITGTLSNQTDLQTALDGKVDENAAITGATKTKITYDAKGLVTAGADAGIADITGLQTALDGKITAFADPNADRIVFWDDSAGAFTALTASTGLTISGTNMTVRSASESQTGIVELATSAETTTGTSTTLAVHPAGLAAQNFLKADTTATLTNKTIDANGTGNSITNLEVADFAGSAIVTAAETISANNNDTTIPTSAAVKAYADSVAGGGGISDGDKGDITVSSSGTVWTVDNDAVTYAKIQNVSAASRLLGRGSASGSGDVEEITIGSGLSLSGTTLSASGGGGGGDVTTLANSATQTGPVNTTTETAIFSYTLPTDLAAGETLVLDITGEVLNNSGSGQTVDIYVKIGTTTAVFYSTTQGTSATKRNFHMRVIVFIVSTTSQKFSVVSQMAPGNTGTGGAITTSFAVGTFAGYGTAAENTTSAKTLQVTADLGAANANFYWYAEAATLTRIAAP